MSFVKAGILGIFGLFLAGCAVYEEAPPPRAYYPAPAYVVPYGSSYNFTYRNYDGYHGRHWH
jgi:hypothetical protein